MPVLSGNEHDQDDKYGELARKLVKMASMSGKKVVLRRNGHSGSEGNTEFLNEIGTTDAAIGDVTAEVMITTLGKIPSEMFYIEETVSSGTVKTTRKLPGGMAVTEEPYQPYQPYPTTTANYETSSHSPVLIALLTALLVILLLCCITACFVAKSKRKNSFFGKGDMECEPGCPGMNQPLLNKMSSTTNKTSMCSLRN